MKFVPVPITGGPTGGKRVLFSVWETRVRDFATYRKAIGKGYGPASEVEQGPDHAAVQMTWNDATGFCAWLTEHERQAGRIGPRDAYRLPSDHEWSCAVGIGDREDPTRPPMEKNDRIADFYPWGTAWPPPGDAGNYWSEEVRLAMATGKIGWVKEGFTGRSDGFGTVAPVGSYAPNALGLHDLAGNLIEWCEDWEDAKREKRILRGGSWDNFYKSDLISSSRSAQPPIASQLAIGFRVVLAPVP